MAWNKAFAVFFVVLGFSLTLSAKTDTSSWYKYAVYFTDKKYTKFTINYPKEFLSERAINRRDRQNIPITESDLPVSAAYLDSLKNLRIIIWYTSKWLNAAMVLCSPADTFRIGRLPFVRKIQILKNKPDTIFIKYRNEKIEKNVQKMRVSSSLYGSSANQIEMLCMDKMHGDGITGKGIYIGVFDAGFYNANTMFYFNHIFSDNRVIDTFDFVRKKRGVFGPETSSHGTEAWSAIAAKAPGELIGGAYEATFALYRTEDEDTEYPVEEFNWLVAAERADSLGIDVINSSLGYTTFDDPSYNYQYKDLDGKKTIVARAAAHCARVGMIVVVSAGNEGSRPWRHISSPGDADSILTVGAVDRDRRASLFSGWGPSADGRIKPDIVAKGSKTTVGKINNTVGFSDGTSFSAPVACGLVAGLWQLFPDLNNLELIQLIRNNASQSLRPDNKMGYGVPCYTHAKTAYFKKESRISVSPTFGKIFPNPAVNGPLILTVSQSDTGKTFTVEIFNSSGKQLYQQTVYSAQVTNELYFDISGVDSGLYFVRVWDGSHTKVFRIVKN